LAFEREEMTESKRSAGTRRGQDGRLIDAVQSVLPALGAREAGARRGQGSRQAPGRSDNHGGADMEAIQEQLGPIDVVVIAYPAEAPMTGDAVPLFLDLVDRGIIRVFDALLVRKAQDGTFSGFDLADLDQDSVGDLSAFAGASTGLLSDDDVALAAGEIEPGTAALLIVYENRWAASFVAAVRRNGGELIAFERIRTRDLISALDAAEAAPDRKG
jgi:Family of unknown function (DUF6325)